MKDSKPFINREISWLSFNERVLQEACDENTPLIERIKFLGIFSNNLDEFFRIRIATVNRIIDLKSKDYDQIGQNPEDLLKKLNEIIYKQQHRFNQIYEDILKELSKHKIFIINENQLNKEQGEFVKEYFKEKVRPNLFPIMLNNLEDASTLKDKSIYLAIHLHKADKTIKDNYAIIKVPTTIISRFLILPSTNEKKYIILLDDIIRFCLEDVFSMFEYDVFDAYTIKLTRDAELDIDNDVSKPFIQLIAESIKKRKKGRPVRFIYDETIKSSLLRIITHKLKISKKDTLIPGSRYHNFKDFISFPNVGAKNFEFCTLPPLVNKDLVSCKSIFSAIEKNDIMLHFPYQSFQYVIDLLREASIDPDVKTIKITLYRLATNSNVANALVNAARNGKNVTVFVELQARFDEKANIYWSQKLIDEKVKIIHGTQGLKVHCKLLLIKKKTKNNKKTSYAFISTGNFNEETAKVYSDDALLTVNEKITSEVDKIFDLFTSNYKPVNFYTLIVSPFYMRNQFIALINNEINFAKEGKYAEIFIKLNNLVDEIIINKLYEASQAGVKIKLIIRGICILVTGINGLSENIQAISIVDRFLEHSRILIFHNNGDEKYFLSSADWMQRNFDYRIEVACPILDKKLQKEIKTIMDIQWRDNVKARILDKDNLNEYKHSKSLVKVHSQTDIYKYIRKNSKDDDSSKNFNF